MVPTFVVGGKEQQTVKTIKVLFSQIQRRKIKAQKGDRDVCVHMCNF